MKFNYICKDKEQTLSDSICIMHLTLMVCNEISAVKFVVSCRYYLVLDYQRENIYDKPKFGVGDLAIAFAFKKSGVFWKYNEDSTKMRLWCPGQEHCFPIFSPFEPVLNHERGVSVS